MYTKIIIRDFAIIIGASILVSAVVVFLALSKPEESGEDIVNEPEVLRPIQVDNPKPNQEIESPLVVSGKARGTWFFEASFPVALTDWDGKIIAQGIATAKSNWMTEDFVPFEATLNFTVDKNVYSRKGVLILKKDNPSGLAANDDSIEIPVIYKETNPADNQGILPYDSGVQGKVMLGPPCPVMRNPPDPACNDKPYKTTVQVIRAGSPQSAPFATAQTDENGNYKIMLPPGDYALQPVGGNVLPRCETKDVKVEPGKIASVDLSCDTGIR